MEPPSKHQSLCHAHFGNWNRIGNFATIDEIFNFRYALLNFIWKYVVVLATIKSQALRDWNLPMRIEGTNGIWSYRLINGPICIVLYCIYLMEAGVAVLFSCLSKHANSYNDFIFFKSKGAAVTNLSSFSWAHSSKLERRMEVSGV